MKKYRLLKDLPHGKAGLYQYTNDEDIGSRMVPLEKGLVDAVAIFIPFGWLNNKEFFEKIIDKELEFKIGQPVVIDNDDNHIYAYVLAYEDLTDEYLVGESWMKASQFRKTAEQELELFYNIK